MTTVLRSFLTRHAGSRSEAICGQVPHMARIEYRRYFDARAKIAYAMMSSVGKPRDQAVVLPVALPCSAACHFKRGIVHG